MDSIVLLHAEFSYLWMLENNLSCVSKLKERQGRKKKKEIEMLSHERAVFYFMVYARSGVQRNLNLKFWSTIKVQVNSNANFLRQVDVPPLPVPVMNYTEEIWQVAGKTGHEIYYISSGKWKLKLAREKRSSISWISRTNLFNYLRVSTSTTFQLFAR